MRLPPTTKLLTALVAGLLLSGLALPNRVSAAAMPARLPTWIVPLTAPALLVQEYRAPLTQFGAGHRGLDYSVRDRQTIYAPADAVVAFVGLVAKKPVVTLRHADALVTAFEPACTTLTPGASVLAGQPIGNVCGSLDYQSHCAPWLCVHFSVRRSGDYLSPRVFIGGLAGARLVQ